jgi:hypothetical protein
MLVRAFRQRESRLVAGPGGAGKTALLAEAMRRHNAANRARVLVPEASEAPDEFVSNLLRLLASAGDPIGAELMRAGRKASARRRSAALIDALASAPAWVVLDHFPPPSAAVMRVIAHILTRGRTPVYFAARDESPAASRTARQIYWCEEMRIALGPLAPDSARELILRETSGLALSVPELADFRAAVLRSSRRLSGAIVKLCTLARDPKYRSHARLKTALLRIDATLMIGSTTYGAAGGAE